MRVTPLGIAALILLSVPASRGAGAEDSPRRAPAPARSPTPTASRTPPVAAPDSVPPSVDLDTLLKHLGERAQAYETIALRFVCIETIHSGDNPRDEKRYDYMYVQAEEQRYRPYRQIHTGRLSKTIAEANIDFDFPDAYSWTLMFVPDRQHLFRFKQAGQEWFSLRQSYILEFAAPLPYTSGKTIYEWSGRVWVDAENYNLLKVEAEPGNQADRLKEELKSYRQSPRFLIYPMGRRPQGFRYTITFLNDLHELSLPDQVDVLRFTLDLQGQQEWESQTVLRYSGYQFFGVDVKDLFQVRK